MSVVLKEYCTKLCEDLNEVFDDLIFKLRFDEFYPRGSIDITDARNWCFVGSIYIKEERNGQSVDFKWPGRASGEIDYVKPAIQGFLDTGFIVLNKEEIEAAYETAKSKREAIIQKIQAYRAEHPKKRKRIEGPDLGRLFVETCRNEVCRKANVFSF